MTIDPVALRALIAAHESDPLDGPEPDGPTTIGEAHAAGRDNLITAYLNAPRVQIARGVESRKAFLRDLTPLMSKQLDTTFLQLWLVSDEVDLSAPALNEALTAVSYPLTRAGSLAEEAFGPGVLITDDDVGKAFCVERYEAIRARDAEYMAVQMAYLEAFTTLKIESDLRDLGEGVFDNETFAAVEQDVLVKGETVRAWRQRRDQGAFDAPDPKTIDDLVVTARADVAERVSRKAGG